MKNKYNFRNIKFNFAGNLKYFLILPLCILLAGVILLCTVGFNKGIDFTGGSIINIVLGDDLNTQSYYDEAKTKINEVLSSKDLSVSVYQLSDMDEGLAITIRYQNKSDISDEEMNDLNEEVKADLYVKFNLNPADSEDASKIQDSQRIGATASSELLMNAFISILVVIAAILIYIAIRFEFTSGMAAILALFHDIIIMGSLMLIFRVEINSSFIAALITIIGYSINNTILIFDRIRENLKLEEYAKASNEAIVNVSIKETLTRSVYMTLTTFLTIFTVAIIGVPSIKLFALPIIFGLIAGAYSSIFIAPGLWAIAYRKKVKQQKIQTKVVED